MYSYSSVAPLIAYVMIISRNLSYVVFKSTVECICLLERVLPFLYIQTILNELTKTWSLVFVAIVIFIRMKPRMQLLFTAVYRVPDHGLFGIFLEEKTSAQKLPVNSFSTYSATDFRKAGKIETVWSLGPGQLEMLKM